LTEALVLEPIRRGAQRVELCAPDCSGCGLSKAAPQWARTMEFSRALCETAGLGAARVSNVPTAKGRAEEIRLPAKASNARRGMLGSLGERWKRSGEAPAPVEAGEMAEAAPEPFREIVQRHAENSKRTDLLRVLDALPGLTVTPKAIPRLGLPLAQLDIDQRCVGCNVCETLCPTGALMHREEGGTYTLEFDAALCTGCRVCELACYHQALHVRETVDLSLLFERRRVTLVSARLAKCRACGERILGEASDYCPACQVSGDRRDAVARRFFSGGIQRD
jgi:ferredoxin